MSEFGRGMTRMSKMDLPARLKVFTCSVCGLFLGIEDVARIRHEHFDEFPRCKHGHMVRSFFVLADDATGEAKRELEQARTAVLALRDMLVATDAGRPGTQQLLADTQLYEAFR